MEFVNKKVPSNYIEIFRPWLTPFFSAVGIFVSILGLSGVYGVPNIVFPILLFAFSIVIISSLITAFYIYKSKTEMQKYEKIISDTSDIQNKTLQFNLFLNKKTNTTICRIINLPDTFALNIKRLIEKSNNGSLLPVETIQEENREDAIKYINDFLMQLNSIYNEYIEQIIDETKTIIQDLIKSNGYELRVSIALKLYNKTYENKFHRDEIKIFTEHRDKETTRENKREIGKLDFSIDHNTDFSSCLQMSRFIKNDVGEENQGDYMNESHDYDKKYNQTVTVPIYMDYSQKRRFGYLCCDILDDRYNKKILNSNTADILEIVSSNIAQIFDQIYGIWCSLSVLKLKQMNDDYNMALYAKCLEGRESK